MEEEIRKTIGENISFTDELDPRKPLGAEFSGSTVLEIRRSECLKVGDRLLEACADLRKVGFGIWI